MVAMERYWVFHEGQLSEALADAEAARVAAGQPVEQAQAETKRIVEFLANAKKLLGGRAGQ